MALPAFIPLILSLLAGQGAQRLAGPAMARLLASGGGQAGKAALSAAQKLPGFGRASGAVRAIQAKDASLPLRALRFVGASAGDLAKGAPFLAGTIAAQQALDSTGLFGEPEVGPSLVPESSRPQPDVGFLLSALADNDEIDPETLDRLMQMIGGTQPQERRLI